MGFKEIYIRTNELKDLSLDELLKELNVSVIYKDEIPLDRKAMLVDNHIFIKNGLNEVDYRNVLLHELGHCLFDKVSFLSNHRTEENNANLFMCFYLVHNEIWDDAYFDTYLIYNGVEPIIARQFNDQVWQFKNQQIMQNGLTHQFDVNI